jgi:hypothetical protein
MVRAVIVLAMQRVNDAVVASYGDRFAAYLTVPGAALNSALRSGVLMFLWCGAVLSLIRLERIRAAVPARLLAISAIWLLYAFGGVVSGRLLVMNRGLPLYLETGLRPPVPVFHPTHLLAVFPTPIADPLGTALAARPRFIVMADASTRLQAELPERYAEAEAYLGQNYRLAARISGVKDSLNLYELAR